MKILYFYKLFKKSKMNCILCKNKMKDSLEEDLLCICNKCRIRFRYTYNSVSKEFDLAEVIYTNLSYNTESGFIYCDMKNTKHRPNVCLDEKEIIEYMIKFKENLIFV